MQDSFFLMVYAFGFVGLAAISLIPLRSWMLLRRFLGHRSWALSLLIGVLVGLTLVFEAKIVFRVFHCLIGEYCGPSIAHGWILLAMLGAAYFAFEAAVGLVSMAVRFASRRAA
ncbi:hypothetical protein [Lysobacter sp. Root494]|uniref:hypothetical protein n=1 Tax=Lysobacter sp. Root494 TaxID=1736549 RepID=UPI0006FEAEBF|nr:hypothetical protein [Lysobacter sp. Root494]KQY51943.1 hypothetical protein ASD14_04520 [Lysobacter sp. Root494]